MDTNFLYYNSEMSPEDQPEEDTCPDKDSTEFEQLLSSTEKAVGRANAAFIVYVTSAIYIFIAAISTTHEDILREAPRGVPFINIQIPLLWFYSVAPWALTALHYTLMGSMYCLFCAAQSLNTTSWDTNVTRRSRVMATVGHSVVSSVLPITGLPFHLKMLSGAAVLAFTVFIPIFLHIILQYKILPYQNVNITIIQRSAFVITVIAMIATWLSVFRISKTRSTCFILFMSIGIGLFSTAFCACFIVQDCEEDFLIKKKVLSDVRFIGEKPSLYYAIFDAIPRSLKLSGRLLFKQKFGIDGVNVNVPAATGDTSALADIANTYDLGLDLSGRSFRYADFSGAQLQRANFADCDLTGTAFVGASLDGSIFNRATCRKTSFYGASLRGASFAGTELIYTNAAHADFNAADFIASKIILSDMSNAKMRGCRFENSRIFSTNAGGSDMRGSMFFDASLNSVVLYKARLERCYFSGSEIKGVDFYGATFSSTTPEEWKKIVEENNKLNIRNEIISARKSSEALDLYRGPHRNLSNIENPHPHQFGMYNVNFSRFDKDGLSNIRATEKVDAYGNSGIENSRFQSFAIYALLSNINLLCDEQYSGLADPSIKYPGHIGDRYDHVAFEDIKAKFSAVEIFTAFSHMKPGKPCPSKFESMFGGYSGVIPDSEIVSVGRDMDTGKYRHVMSF